MEIQDQNRGSENENMENRWRHHHNPAGKVFAGILVVAVGGLLMARQLGADIPHWVLSWKMLLIAIGLFVGLKHSFRTWGWMMPVLVGGVFLLEDFVPGMALHTFFWPVMLMFIGLMIIFKPRRHHRYKHWKHGQWRQDNCGNWNKDSGFNSSEDLLDAVAVFGSVKKNIISKNFKGGEATCVFGGGMINLLQADINGNAILEINAVFGGIKLYVPQHWQIQTTDLVTVMGGIDDKRATQNHASIQENKVLVLKGAAVFGGIEILN